MSEQAKTAWTQDQFFAWAQQQAGRYEFDGFAPVAITGGTVVHGRILRRLHRSLKAALSSGGCEPLGPDVGVATLGNAVRYPDALITCSDMLVQNQQHTVSGVIVVFEIVSPHSGRVDRIVKVREYAAVPTIRRYVIIEGAFPGLHVLSREKGSDAWSTTVLSAGETLRMPEVGAEFGVDSIYEGVFPPDAAEA